MRSVRVPSIIVEVDSASCSGEENCADDNKPPEQDLADENHIHPSSAFGDMRRKRGSAEQILDPSQFDQFLRNRRSHGSISDEARNITKRASQLIIEVPVAGLKKIGATQGANSLGRETQHFVGITTMHGPLRMYRGKRYSRLFWGIMMITCLILLLYQMGVLFQMYTSRPTTSEVNFLIAEDGMDFPMVTICNFNPIRKNYIKSFFFGLNATHDFSETLLDYLIQYNYEVHNLFSNGDQQLLDQGQRELEFYKQRHPNFTIRSFFENGGFPCNDLIKICSFAGVDFDCCQHTRVVFTDLGKCFLLNTSALPDSSMKRQTAGGVNSGLQIILDAHLEEQFDGNKQFSAIPVEPQPIFTNALENGFRYYIHESDTIPHVVSEGISVSPGATVYSAITVSNYDLLDKGSWGNCTRVWPKGFNSARKYSSANCASICKARYFNDKCGCAPFVFNLDESYISCTPNQTYTCMRDEMSSPANGRRIAKLPVCKECGIECASWKYAAFNSYGQGFSAGAVKWIQFKNQTWSAAHIRSNFVAVNVFYRDLTYTKYIQQAGTSLTEILSDIGGNMGMWLGMSVLTIVEAFIFFTKVTWIFISRKRREYMYEKKRREQDKEKELEDTMNQLKTINHLDEEFDEETTTTLNRLKQRIEQNLRRKTGRMNRVAPIAPIFAVPDRKKSSRRHSITEPSEIDQKEADAEEQRKQFMNNFYSNVLYGDGRAQDEDEPTSGLKPQQSVLELKIDLDSLENRMANGDTDVTLTPASCEYVSRSERARSIEEHRRNRTPSFYVNLSDDVFE